MPETTTRTDLPTAMPAPHHRARRFVGDTWRALPGLTRRAVSALLRLSWHLDVTVVIDAEIHAADRATAVALLQQYLQDPGTRLVAYRPSRGPEGWRPVADVTVPQLRVVTVHDGHDDTDAPWSATVIANARITVPARDVDANIFFDVEPEPRTDDVIGRVLTSHRDLTRAYRRGDR